MFWGLQHGQHAAGYYIHVHVHVADFSAAHISVIQTELQAPGPLSHLNVGIPYMFYTTCTCTCATSNLPTHDVTCKHQSILLLTFMLTSKWGSMYYINMNMDLFWPEEKGTVYMYLLAPKEVTSPDSRTASNYDTNSVYSASTVNKEWHIPFHVHVVPYRSWEK